MHYLISGLAKSGTTILFSRMQQAIQPAPATFFEPDRDEQLCGILDTPRPTLSKVLVGRVTAQTTDIARFDRHVLIYRDPRDQFISMLLYLFYDFQLSGNQAAYDSAVAALARKVEAPGQHSAIALYNDLAQLVGRAPFGVFNKLHQVQAAYREAFAPLPLRYEDFIDGRLAAVEEYLGLDLANDASVPSEYGRVARSRAYGDWHQWLNDDDRAQVNRDWGDTLQALGYEPCGAAAAQQIPRGSSLDYVAQFDPSAS